MNDAIHELIDNILMDQGGLAQETFQDIMALKMNDALDAQKIVVAQQLGQHQPE